MNLNSKGGGLPSNPILCRAAGVEAPEGLRLTIWRHVPNGRKDAEELEQVVPYVGGEGGVAGRKHSVNCGLIGKAFRERAAFFTHYNASSSDDDIRAELRKQGYTRKQTQDLDLSKRSLAAVPIFKDESKGDPVAVIFLDCTKVDAFVSKEFVNACDDGATGIAEYVKKRYRP